MRFELVWYRFFPNFWIGVLASCPAQAEARKAYPRPLRPKLRSGGTFSSKHQKNAILAKSHIFSRKLRLWMSLRDGLLGNTLVAMPQGLKIQKKYVYKIENKQKTRILDSCLKSADRLARPRKFWVFFAHGPPVTWKFDYSSKKNMRIFFSIEPKTWY